MRCMSFESRVSAEQEQTKLSQSSIGGREWQIALRTVGWKSQSAI